MRERHTCLLHNIQSEASDLFLVVSLFVFFLSLSPFLIFCFVDVLCCLALLMQTPPLFKRKHWLAMDSSDTSSTPTPSDFVASDETNIWNPVLELLFHAHVGAFMEKYFDETDLGRIVQRRFIVLMNAPFGTIALGASLRMLSAVTVTTQALLVPQSRGGTSINKGGHLLNLLQVSSQGPYKQAPLAQPPFIFHRSVSFFLSFFGAHPLQFGLSPSWWSQSPARPSTWAAHFPSLCLVSSL